jgi:hypothetical protein
MEMVKKVTENIGGYSKGFRATARCRWGREGKEK